MVFMLLCVSILIVNNQAGYIDCSRLECRQASIDCVPNEDCTIDCYGTDSCTDAIINCPENECAVYCYGDRACEGSIINASLSFHLLVNSSGYQSGPSEIYCSEQYDYGIPGEESCEIYGFDYYYPQYNNLELYVHAGIDDVFIECENRSCIENSTLFCGSNFSPCDINDVFVFPPLSTSGNISTNISKSNTSSTTNLDVPSSPTSSNKENQINSIIYTMIGILCTLLVVASIYFMRRYLKRSKKLQKQENLPQLDPDGDSANNVSHSHSNSTQEINIQVPGLKNTQIDGNLDLDQKEGDHPQTYLNPTQSTLSNGGIEGNVVVTAKGKKISATFPSQLIQHKTLSTDSMYNAHSPSNSNEKKTNDGTSKGQSRGIDLSVNDIKIQRSMESTQVLDEALMEVLKIPSNHSNHGPDITKDDHETNTTNDVYNEKNGDV